MHWFREAFALLGPNGSVFVAASDLHAPWAAVVDLDFAGPPVASPGYAASLLDLCAEQDVALLISLNDYELQRLAGGLAEQLARSNAWLTALTFKGGPPPSPR